MSTLVNLTSERVVLHSHPNPISGKVGGTLTLLPASKGWDGWAPIPLQYQTQDLRFCIQAKDTAGNFAGYLMPLWVAYGSPLEEGEEVPPLQEHTIYIVPEAVRASHPNRTDLASLAHGGGLIMSPWESAK